MSQALMYMPWVSCWLPGKAECVEVGCGHTVRSSGRGDVVRPGELSAYARRMRILLLLFLAALFGNHFKIPPKSTH